MRLKAVSYTASCRTVPPTVPGIGPEALDPALERFAGARHLPDQGRGILENCLVTRHFPIE